METPNPLVASHLALLARLELLHQSSLLAHAPSSSSSSSALETPTAERVSVGQEDSQLVPESEKETVREGWEETRDLAKQLGNGLRDESLRLPLARTSLPSTLADLLRLALSIPTPLPSPASFKSVLELDVKRPEGILAEAAVEILRAAGNGSYDCDEARSNLLSANFPQLVLLLLRSLLSKTSTLEVDLKEANGAFRLVKTALGALMNVSMDHDEILKALLTMEGSLQILLEVAERTYVPSPWAGQETDEFESWATREERCTVASWSWKVFGDVCALESAPPVLASLAPSLLPLLLPPVLAYIPPSPSASHSTPPPPYPSSLLSADLSLLTIAVQTLESQTLDSPSWQSTLHSLSEFTLLLDFIDRATLPVLLPPDEDDDDDEETSEEDRQKTFGSLKGGVVKSVVAAFSDDSVGKEVFARGKEEGGEMERLMGWLGEGEREDMVICAVLSLGNLARSEEHCTALVRPPFNLLPSLLPLLKSETDVKIQHALVGLLKNLSVPDSNKDLMADEGVMEGVSVGMGTLEDKRDVVGSVQGGAVGVVKNLCKGSPRSAARLVSPVEGHHPTILALLLALFKRANDFAIRAESARVLVNAVRSLFSSKSTDEPSEEVARAKETLVGSEEVVGVLVGLLTGGAQAGYSVLVAEGVMALAILASSGLDAAELVSKALLAPSFSEGFPPTSPSEASTSSAVSPSSPVGPTSALDLLSSLLSPLGPKGIQSTAELKGNACTLLTAAGRAAEDKSLFRGVLEGWEVEDEGLLRVRELGLRVLK